MGQAILLGTICVTIYGLFLCIRGMIRLYKEKEMKMLTCVGVYLLAAPLAVWGILSMDVSKASIWIIVPGLILVFVWICMGYFLEAYLRKEKRRKEDGEKKIIPVPSKGVIRKNLILMGISLIIWVYGAFVGINNATLETCAVCVVSFLFARSLAALWRYRGF